MTEGNKIPDTQQNIMALMSHVSTCLLVLLRLRSIHGSSDLTAGGLGNGEPERQNPPVHGRERVLREFTVSLLWFLT